MRRVEVIIIDTGSFPGEATRLCAELKASPAFGHIPIVLLFSTTNTGLRIQCLEAGADALLEKPYSRTHLLAQIKNLDTNRTRVKQYFSHPPTEPAAELTFSQQLQRLISDNLSNAELNVDFLARLMNLSRSTFYRKMKETSGISLIELINTARLKKAAELIKNTDHTISGVALMVGFYSRSNFGKAFFKHFHISPTAFRNNHKLHIADFS